MLCSIIASLKLRRGVKAGDLDGDEIEYLEMEFDGDENWKRRLLIPFLGIFRSLDLKDESVSGSDFVYYFSVSRIMVQRGYALLFIGKTVRRRSEDKRRQRKTLRLL